MRAAWVASSEPLPGRLSPSASVRQFMELAVNMPEQEPQVGQAERSSSATDASLSLLVTRGDHGVDQVQMQLLALAHHLAGLHRPARDEDRRDVQAQRGHQHAGRDLVAVGDADQGVRAVGVDHVLDRVGDHLARGQGIEHAAVTHGDAVVDGDGVELLRHAAGGLDLARDQLAQILEMDMAGDELGEGVDDGDDGLVEIPVRHAGGAPERACAGHVAAMGGGAGAVLGHGEATWRGGSDPAKYTRLKRAR